MNTPTPKPSTCAACDGKGFYWFWSNRSPCPRALSRVHARAGRSVAISQLTMILSLSHISSQPSLFLHSAGRSIASPPSSPLMPSGQDTARLRDAGCRNNRGRVLAGAHAPTLSFLGCRGGVTGAAAHPWFLPKDKRTRFLRETNIGFLEHFPHEPPSRRGISLNPQKTYLTTLPRLPPMA
jgi:hypothetical protein